MPENHSQHQWGHFQRIFKPCNVPLATTQYLHMLGSDISCFRERSQACHHQKSECPGHAVLAPCAGACMMRRLSHRSWVWALVQPIFHRPRGRRHTSASCSCALSQSPCGRQCSCPHLMRVCERVSVHLRVHERCSLDVSGDYLNSVGLRDFSLLLCFYVLIF